MEPLTPKQIAMCVQAWICTATSPVVTKQGQAEATSYLAHYAPDEYSRIKIQYAHLF